MASAGDTVYPTVAELAGLGTWVSQSITGLDFPAGYEHQLLGSGSISLSITEESAKEQGHAIEDLSIEIQAPPVNATDCQSTQTWAGLNLSHRNNVGLYGPHPAHTHTDWVGSAGADNPDSGGAFTVTGGPGAVTLTLDSGFATRLGQAAAQDFPAGMPGVPQLYWYHKADLWHEYDGQNGVTTGDPYSCPPEAVYCWRGWAWLLTRLNAPSESTVTLTVTGKAYTYSDPHCSGSARQTDFEYTGADFTHTYTQTVAAGDQYVYWCLPNPSTEALVDCEVVETVALSGLVAGNWTLYEPKLVLDVDASVTEHCTIKAFEAPCQAGDENHAGGGYRKGGFSAHVDAAFYKALFWGDDQNANVAEQCGGMFDLLLSANYEIDNTTAFSLSGLADLITNCCDAWSCATNSAYTAATTDADSNVIPTWAFDVVPLEQSVDAGTANCSFRSGTWTVARGIVCKVVTDKFIGGKAHGLAQIEGVLKRSGAIVDIMRRTSESGTWTLYQDDVTATVAAHWCSDNLPEVYQYTGDTPTYYRYGARHFRGYTPDTDVARAPVREYVIFEGQAPPVQLWDPYTVVGKHGGVWRVATDVNGVVHCHEAGPTEAVVFVTKAAPFGITTSYQRPSVAESEDGRLLVCATQSGSMIFVQSADRATTWGSELMAQLGTDIQQGTIKSRDGTVYACGWKASDSKVYFRASSQSSLAQDDLTGDSVYEIAVCTVTVAEGADPPRSDIAVLDDRSLIVTVEQSGSMNAYRSRSFSATSGFEALT